MLTSIKLWVLTSLSILHFFQVCGGQVLQDLGVPLQLDEGYAQGQWQPVLNAIGHHKIVLLGEANHKSKEIFMARNDLIQALHQEAGFDVVLFEAGIGEVGAVAWQRDHLSAQQMTRSLFGFWRTPAFIELMSYIKSNELDLGGLDVQRTNSRLFGSLAIDLAAYGDLDTSRFLDLENQYSIVNRKLVSREAIYDSVQAQVKDLVRGYEELSQQLAAFKKPEKQLLLVGQTIKNRIAYLNYRLQFLVDRDYHRRWASRDQQMAENFLWLREHLFPNRKIIVVAHNYHISKTNEQETVMGEILKEQCEDNIFVLGSFLIGDDEDQPDGRTADEIGLHQARSLMEDRGYFMHIKPHSSDPEHWLNHPIRVNNTFIDLTGTQQLTMSTHFDGILILKSSDQ